MSSEYDLDTPAIEPGSWPQHVLRHANSSNYLNNTNPNINGNRLSAKSGATKSAADLLLAMEDSSLSTDKSYGNSRVPAMGRPDSQHSGINGSLITPTNARFEFTKPLKHQISNSSMSSASVSNLNLTSPSPIRSLKSPNKSMNSAERNAKYLSVIDLYDDDDLTNPIPSPIAASHNPEIKSSLSVEPNGKSNDTKETIYSPTSINSFNFVSKNFDESSDDLSSAPIPVKSSGQSPYQNFNKIDDIANGDFSKINMDNGQGNTQGRTENKHKKQETLYYSPPSSIKDIGENGDIEEESEQLQHFNEQSKGQLNEPVKITASQENIVIPPPPRLGRSISQNQINAISGPPANEQHTMHKASSALNLKAKLKNQSNLIITPISFATTPLINVSSPSSLHLKTPSNISGTGSTKPADFTNCGNNNSTTNISRPTKASNLSNNAKSNDVSSSTSNFTVSNSSNTNVRNFINNNQSLLSLQTSKQSSSLSNKIPIGSNSKSLLSSSRDRYGFKKKSTYISEEQYNEWWISYEPYLVRRKKKWVTLMMQNGLNLNKDSPVRFPPKSNKLKRYVRKGIPAEWRGNAWWFFAKGDEKLNANPGLYDKIVASTAGIKTHDSEIIERDLNRTFPDNIYFRDAEADSNNEEETPLIQSLRRVLVAFATYQPQIGYCQSLNFLAGLLLIFLDEEKAFWMLVIITSKLLPGVHDVNLEGVNVDQGVLMLCVKEYLPNIWEKIGFNFESIGAGGQQNFNNEVNVVTKLPPITLCTASWFMSAYIGILPIETCLRVWDCFFYEESKFFFRIALSILKLAESKIERIKDEMEIFQIIQNFPKKLIEPKEVFDCCFKKRNGFSNLTQEEINRCRKFVKEQRQKASKYELTAKVGDLAGINGAGDNAKGNGATNTAEEDELSKLKKDFAEGFIPDEYDFKKNGLAGVHWKRSLTKKLLKQKHHKRNT